jgi:hypothetical protein
MNYDSSQSDLEEEEEDLDDCNDYDGNYDYSIELDSVILENSAESDCESPLEGKYRGNSHNWQHYRSFPNATHDGVILHTKTIKGILCGTTCGGHTYAYSSNGSHVAKCTMHEDCLHLMRIKPIHDGYQVDECYPHNEANVMLKPSHSLSSTIKNFIVERAAVGCTAMSVMTDML